VKKMEGSMSMNFKVVGCEEIRLMKLPEGGVQQYSIKCFLSIIPYSHAL
jgi:hypothetical protein